MDEIGERKNFQRSPPVRLENVDSWQIRRDAAAQDDGLKYRYESWAVSISQSNYHERANWC